MFKNIFTFLFNIMHLESDTLRNTYYRKAVRTNKYQQLVLMSLAVGEDIPMEKHKGSQFFRIEKGTGIAYVADKKILLKDGVGFIVPPNTKHYVKNTSTKKPLKLYTIYCPPQHKPDAVNKRQPKE